MCPFLQLVRICTMIVDRRTSAVRRRARAGESGINDDRCDGQRLPSANTNSAPPTRAIILNPSSDNVRTDMFPCIVGIFILCERDACREIQSKGLPDESCRGRINVDITSKKVASEDRTIIYRYSSAPITVAVATTHVQHTDRYGH